MQGFQKKYHLVTLLVSNVGASAALWFSEQVLFLAEHNSFTWASVFQFAAMMEAIKRQQPLQVLDIELLRRFFFGCTTTGPAHMTTRSMPMPAPACGYEPYLNASM